MTVLGSHVLCTIYPRRTPHCGNYGSLLGLNRLYSVSVSQPSYLTVSLSPAPIALPTPRDHRISALPPVLVVPNVDSYPVRDGCVPYTPIQHHKSWPVCVTATAGTDGWTGLEYNKHQYDLLYLDIKISNLGHLVTPSPNKGSGALPRILHCCAHGCSGRPVSDT